MMKKNNFLSLSFVYGLGYLLVRAVSFLLLPLYTNILTPFEVGFIFLFLTFVAFLNTIYNHGMDSSLLKYYNLEESKKTFTTSLFYSIILGFVFSIIIILFEKLIILFVDNSTLYIPNNLSFCLIVILFCDMISSRTKNLIRLLEKPYYYLFVSLVNVCISLFLNIYLIKILSMKIEGALLALCITSVFQFFVLLPIIFSNIKIKLFDKTLLKNMLKFGLPFLPASICFIIIEMSDRWMIEWLTNLHEVGLYGSGYKIGSLILMVVLGFNLSWQPFYLKHKNIDDTRQFQTIGSLFVFCLIVFSWFVSCFSPFLLKIELGSFSIIGKEFWGGLSIIPFICISYIFYGVFITQMPNIYLRNKQNWISVFWGLGALFNIICNYFMIQKFGFIGAAFSTLLTYFFMSCLIIYKNNSWGPIPINYHNLIFCFLFASFSYLMIIYGPPIVAFIINFSFFLFAITSITKMIKINYEK